MRICSFDLCRRLSGVAITGLAAFWITSSAHAQISIYVLQMGDGVALNANHAPVSILEFSGTTSGMSLSNSWAAPSVDPSDRITISANATTHGLLNRSLDGRYLVFGGREVAVGGAASTATTVVIGTFHLGNQVFNTSTRLTEYNSGPTGTELYSGGASAGAFGRVRSVASTDGSEFWFVGQMQGVHYAKLGATSAARGTNTTNEYSDIQIRDGKFFASRPSATTRGVWFWNSVSETGDAPLPNESGRFASLGTGWETGATGQLAGTYHSFEFFNDEYLFIANGRMGGIQVFNRSNPNTESWNLLTGDGQSLTGVGSGVTHLSILDEGEQVWLFLTTGTGTASSHLWSVAWNPQDQTFGSANLLATADAGYTFGGLVAIPEPSTYALIFGAFVLGAVVFLRRRRR
jgi:hypothetical protein